MEDIIQLNYLIEKDQDLSWGLVVSTTGCQDINPHAPYPPKSHPAQYLFSTENGRILNEYQLIYISKGQGYFTSKGQNKVEVKEGDMFLLFPGEWHNYSPGEETGWFEYWIGFNGTDMDNRVIAEFFIKNKPIFNVGKNEEIINLYKIALRTSKEQKSGYQQILAGIVNLLLGFAYSANELHTFEDIKVTNQINKAKTIMHDNVLTGITCEEIAQRVGMGYSWFRRIFKLYTGFAPAQYMQELKVNKSKELLTNTMLTCQEIAYEIGFETPSYFNITFKRKTGITPKEYRKQTQERII